MATESIFQIPLASKTVIWMYYHVYSSLRGAMNMLPMGSVYEVLAAYMTVEIFSVNHDTLGKDYRCDIMIVSY